MNNATFKLLSVGLICVSSLWIGSLSNATAPGVNVCVAKSSGAVRKLTGKSCKTTETKETWSVQGEAGPAGPAGAQGPQGLQGANGRDASLPASAVLHIFDANGNDLGVKFPDINACVYNSSFTNQTCFSPWDGSVLPLAADGDGSIYFSDNSCSGDLLVNVASSPSFPTKFATVKSHTGINWGTTLLNYSDANDVTATPHSVLWDVGLATAFTSPTHIVCVPYVSGAHLPNTDNAFGNISNTPLMQSGSWRRYAPTGSLPQYAVPLTFRTVFN